MGFQFQSVATLSYSLVPQFGVTYAQFGLLISCYLLPGIIVAYPGGTLGKRFGDKQIAILGLTLMVVGGLVDGTTMNYAAFFGGRSIAGIGAVLLNVLLLKMATDWFLGREIGTALALLATSWPVGIGIALIVLPWIAITYSIHQHFSLRLLRPPESWFWSPRSTAPRKMPSCPKVDRASAFRGAKKDWCHWRVSSGLCLMSVASLS